MLRALSWLRDQSIYDISTINHYTVESATRNPPIIYMKPSKESYLDRERWFADKTFKSFSKAVSFERREIIISPLHLFTSKPQGWITDIFHNQRINMPTNDFAALTQAIYLITLTPPVPDFPTCDSHNASYKFPMTALGVPLSQDGYLLTSTVKFATFNFTVTHSKR